MNDEIYKKALTIAAIIMQRDGLCRHESVDACRRVYVDERVCQKCIREWLISKAKRELRTKK